MAEKGLEEVLESGVKSAAKGVGRVLAVVGFASVIGTFGVGVYEGITGQSVGGSPTRSLALAYGAGTIGGGLSGLGMVGEERLRWVIGDALDGAAYAGVPAMVLYGIGYGIGKIFS